MDQHTPDTDDATGLPLLALERVDANGELYFDGASHRRLELPPRTLRLGRSPDVEIRLDDDAHERVSRHHITIQPRFGTWYMWDAGSRYGTSLLRIDAPNRHQLRAHDHHAIVDGMNIMLGRGLVEGPRVQRAPEACLKVTLKGAPPLTGAPTVNDGSSEDPYNLWIWESAQEPDPRHILVAVVRYRTAERAHAELSQRCLYQRGLRMFNTRLKELANHLPSLTQDYERALALDQPGVSPRDPDGQLVRLNVAVFRDTLIAHFPWLLGESLPESRCGDDRRP